MIFNGTNFSPYIQWYMAAIKEDQYGHKLLEEGYNNPDTK